MEKLSGFEFKESSSDAKSGEESKEN